MLAKIDFTAMTENEVMAFWKRYHRATRKDAEALCGGRFPGYTTVAASAANYACNLAVAKGCRRRGDERAARVYDYAAQLALEDIPDRLRPEGVPAPTG